MKTSLTLYNNHDLPITTAATCEHGEGPQSNITQWKSSFWNFWPQRDKRVVCLSNTSFHSFKQPRGVLLWKVTADEARCCCRVLFFWWLQCNYCSVGDSKYCQYRIGHVLTGMQPENKVGYIRQSSFSERHPPWPSAPVRCDVSLPQLEKKCEENIIQAEIGFLLKLTWQSKLVDNNNQNLSLNLPRHSRSYVIFKSSGGRTT